MKSLVTADKLRKVYPPVTGGDAPFVAVDGISFEIQNGEILGLLGPNGAGKSTTISMLLGVLTPTSGTITYFGKNFSQSRSDILQHVTFASTYIKMPWRLTVLENLRIYGLLYGVAGKQFEKRVHKFLTTFGVWNQRNKTMNELSAGQTTRIMLAKAFIPHPRVVLLDEPTASLDPDIAHEVRSFVKQQQKEFGTTILYTSHNMSEVADVCDRVMFMKHGTIIATDTPDKLASSVSTARMRLMVRDGLKRIQRFASEQELPNHIDGREIEITLEEQDIASFLAKLADNNISYTQISIAKPTLEDYFLHMSKDSSVETHTKNNSL